jgi:hypothetical protein
LHQLLHVRENTRVGGRRGGTSTGEREEEDPQEGEEGQDEGQCVGCHTQHLNEPVRKTRRGGASTTTRGIRAQASDEEDAGHDDPSHGHMTPYPHPPDRNIPDSSTRTVYEFF